MRLPLRGDKFDNLLAGTIHIQFSEVLRNDPTQMHIFRQSDHIGLEGPQVICV